jgi:hypothetical protein
MSEETKIEGIVSEQKTRRSAIKTAAQVAVTAPAVGLLLSAGTKSAMAQQVYKTGDDFVTVDDSLAQNGGAQSDAILGDDAVTF